MKPMSRIFGVARHQLLLCGLKTLVSESPTPMKWLGSHPPDEQVFREIDRHRPHVIIMDDNALTALPQAPSQWKQQKIGTVLISQIDECTEMAQLLHHGILGLVHDSEPPGSLFGAISSVINQRIWVPARLRDYLLSLSLKEPRSSDLLPGIPRARQTPLSPKEKQLIGLVLKHPDAKSLTLADWMGVRESTIRNRLSRIYSKLRIHGRAALVKYAHRHNMTSTL